MEQDADGLERLDQGGVIRTHPGRILVAAVFFVVWGLITHGTFAGSGDEPHYLIISHSLAFDGDLDLANNYREASLITANTLAPDLHARFHDGRLRPVHDIGLPLLFAPVVRLAYSAAEVLGAVLPSSVLQATRLNEALLFRHQISLLMALLAGLLARELFLLLRGLAVPVRPAFWWALLFVLSPPLLSHAFLFFTEIPSALAATMVFRRLSLRPVQHPASGARVGVLAGALLLLHARNVGLVAGLAILAVLGVRRRAIPRAAGAACLAGIAAGLAARTLTTYLMWGSWIATPIATLGGLVPLTVMGEETFVRLTGLLFDREHGLLAYAPVYVLAVAGLFLRGRRPARVSTDLAIVLAAYLLPILLPQINPHGWRGGWSPAARFLVPVAPLLCVAAYLYAAAGTRRLVVAVVALQVGINAYVWQFPRTLWNDGDGIASFPLARWLPSWTDAGPTHVTFFAAALGTLVAFGYACARFASRSAVPIARPAPAEEPSHRDPGRS